MATRARKISRQGERLQALKESEQHFDALLEQSREAMVLLDPNGVVLYASPSTQRLWGYPSRELIGRVAFEGIHPDDQDSAAQFLAALVAEPGKSLPITFRFQHRDGSWRWMEGTATNLVDDAGVGAIVGNYQDITERKVLENNLQFLAYASKLLSSSLDFETIWQTLTKLAVPYVADWCAVDILNEQGVFDIAAIAHKDPEKVALVSAYRQANPIDVNGTYGLPVIEPARKTPAFMRGERRAVPCLELGWGGTQFPGHLTCHFHLHGVNLFESRALSTLQTRQEVVRTPSETKRAYRYRFSPTPQHAGQLARTFGGGRFIDTWGLATRQHASFHERPSRYSHDLAAMLPALTEAYPVLCEVCCVPLQQALRHLERALVHFLEGRADSPTFNKNRNDRSATSAATAFTWDGHCLTRAKRQAPLALGWPRPLPDGTKPARVTVSRESAGRSFVSILLRQQIKPLALTPRRVGVDLGLTSCVVTSAGQEIATPQPSRRVQKQVAQAQRRHARQKHGSKNRAQARRKVARIHARRADRRRDSQHQHSHRLTRENQVIGVERLVVKTRLKHPHLAKSISDVGWAEFVRQRGDKATWDGRTLITIDQWFPSSKTCHACQ